VYVLLEYFNGALCEFITASGLFTYLNTFKIVWEQGGLDNQGSTVLTLIYKRG